MQADQLHDIQRCATRIDQEKRLNRMMKAAVVTEPNVIKVVERATPEPLAQQVRLRVEACGICHSDVFTVAAAWPGLELPRIPGHEIAGTVDAIGEGVVGWSVGQRAGVGWHGGHCGTCDRCRRGDFVLCREGKVPGISYDGGYAEYVVVPAATLAPIPPELSAAEAAPLFCAGITVYNALRNSSAKAGDVVAILGIGGLGHLGVQYASKMGFTTVAIARGGDKEAFAKQLGAHHYVDSSAQNVAEALQALGGASVVLATVTSGRAMTAALGALAVDGELIILGVSQEPVEVNTTAFVMGRHRVKGWPSGTATDSADTLRFSALSGVRAMIEEYPLERAAEAYARMMSGDARFRVVVKM